MQDEVSEAINALREELRQQREEKQMYGDMDWQQIAPTVDFTAVKEN